MPVFPKHSANTPLAFHRGRGGTAGHSCPACVSLHPHPDRGRAAAGAHPGPLLLSALLVPRQESLPPRSIPLPAPPRPIMPRKHLLSKASAQSTRIKRLLGGLVYLTPILLFFLPVISYPPPSRLEWHCPCCTLSYVAHSTRNLDGCGCSASAREYRLNTENKRPQ